MGVIVQRHGDVGVAHDVLQRLGVHTGVCHAGTERVPEGVRGDGQLLLVLLVVLLRKAPNHVVIVHAHFRRPVPFEKQEVGVPVHRDGGFLPPVLQHPLQRPVDRLTHGDFPIAALGLGRFDVVAVLAVPQKLVVYPDQPVLKVKVRSQPAELGNAQSGSQQDDKLIGVLLIYRVILRKVDQAYLLFRRQHGFLAPVVLQNFVQGKAERIFANTIVLNGDEECGPERTLVVADGLEAKALFPHADGPLLCVGGLHRVDAFPAERVAPQEAHQVLPLFLGAPLHIHSLTVLLGVELADGHFFTHSVDAVRNIPVDPLFFLPQGNVVPLASRGLVRGYQLPGIDELGLAGAVRVLICVSPVFSLALSSS